MSDAIARWDQEIAKLMSRGMSRSEAFLSLSKSDSKLREEYTTAYNMKHNRIYGHGNG